MSDVVVCEGGINTGANVQALSTDSLDPSNFVVTYSSGPCNHEGFMRVMDLEDQEIGQPELRFYYYIGRTHGPPTPHTPLMKRFLVETDEHETGQPVLVQEYFDNSVPDFDHDGDSEDITLHFAANNNDDVILFQKEEDNETLVGK